MGNPQLLSRNHRLNLNWREDSMKTWGKYNEIENVFFYTVDNTDSSFLAILTVFLAGEPLVPPSLPSFFQWDGGGGSK